MIGNCTAACKKGQRNTFPLKDRWNYFYPQHGMGRPAALANAGKTGRAGRFVGENRKGSYSVHQETPMRKLVYDVDQLAGWYVIN
jgi:hypothetical protein